MPAAPNFQVRAGHTAALSTLPCASARSSACGFNCLHLACVQPNRFQLCLLPSCNNMLCSRKVIFNVSHLRPEPALPQALPAYLTYEISFAADQKPKLVQRIMEAFASLSKVDSLQPSA